MSSPLVAVPSPRHPHLHHPRGKSLKPWSSCVWPHSSWGKKKKARTTHQYLNFFPAIFWTKFCLETVFFPMGCFKFKSIQVCFFCKGKVILKRMDTICLLIYFFYFASFREIIGKQRDGTDKHLSPGGGFVGGLLLKVTRKSFNGEFFKFLFWYKDLMSLCKLYYSPKGSKGFTKPENDVSI